MKERLFKGTRTRFKISSTSPGLQSRGRERREAGMQRTERS